MRDWFEPEQRFRLRHLIDDDLVVAQRLLRNAMARLDDRRVRGIRRGADAGGAGEEAPDGNGIRRVVGALVDDLQHIVSAQDRRGHLNTASAPAVGQRHLARAERHLVAWDRNRLEESATHHPLRRARPGRRSCSPSLAMAPSLREGAGGGGDRTSVHVNCAASGRHPRDLALQSPARSPVRSGNRRSAAA